MRNCKQAEKGLTWREGSKTEIKALMPKLQQDESKTPTPRHIIIKCQKLKTEKSIKSFAVFLFTFIRISAEKGLLLSPSGRQVTK